MQTIFQTGKRVQPPFVLIFQMGRVGSKSIEDALLQFYSKSSTKVFHLHYATNFPELQKRAEIDLLDPSKFYDHIPFEKKRATELLSVINEEKIKIISLVRDPIARNSSTFFYALDEFIPDWESTYTTDRSSGTDLVNIFISKRNFVLTALNWFDEQLKPVFGIDVYATSFPKEAGYKIYSSSKADLLLLRLEDLASCSQEAFLKFLNISNIYLPKINTNEERRAGRLYNYFLKTPLPEEYVDWTYSHKLASHFYSQLELNNFKGKWTKRSNQ